MIEQKKKKMDFRDFLVAGPERTKSREKNPSSADFPLKALADFLKYSGPEVK